MREVASRAIRVVEVETTQPSPYSRTLLFDYVGAFMYEGDQPLAEAPVPLRSPRHTTLLAELLGTAGLRELLDAGRRTSEVETELAWLTPSRQDHPTA